MFLKKSSFKLAKNFDFYLHNNDRMLIWGLFGREWLKLPFCYVKRENLNFSFIFLSNYYMKSFVRHLESSCSRFFYLYYFRLRLKGLGFRVKRIYKFLYRFYFTVVNFFYFHIPFNVVFKYKARRLFFLSNSFFTLRTLIVHLLLLKRLVVYKLRGIFFPRIIILMKPGKKRF